MAHYTRIFNAAFTSAALQKSPSKMESIQPLILTTIYIISTQIFYSHLRLSFARGLVSASLPAKILSLPTFFHSGYAITTLLFQI